MTFGIAPRNINSLSYTGSGLYFVPCVEFPRTPSSNDRNYPLFTFARVNKEAADPTKEGDLYYLARFEPNGANPPDAVWIRVTAGLGPGGNVVSLTGDDGTIILPDVDGNVNIDGLVVANATESKAVYTDSPSADTMNIKVQVGAAIAATDITKVGLLAADSTHFTVDANGFLQLAAGNIVQSIGVDLATLPGTDPVLPDVNGVIEITGAQVAAGDVGANVIQTHSVDPSSFEIQIQRAEAVSASALASNGVSHYSSFHFDVDSQGFVEPTAAAAAASSNFDNAGVASFHEDHFDVDADGFVDAEVALASATSVLASAGIASFDSSQFTVDANGWVQIQGDITGGQVSNIGIAYSGGTFTVQGYDGTALSASNPGVVWLQDKTTPGRLRRYLVTANQTFTDGAAGTTDNQRFGLTTGVNWSNDLPFFLYAVTNDALDTINFMISRNPCATSSPAAASIGKTGAVVNVGQGDFFSLADVTVADYESNPCLCIGSFRMTFVGATDSWTVSALSVSDGVGQFNDQTLFTVPSGVNGAASGKYFQNNGGTAPGFTTSNYTYKLGRDGVIICFLSLDICNVVGLGAVELRLMLPYQAGGTTGTWSYQMAYTFGGTGLHYIIVGAISTTYMGGFLISASATAFTNAGIGAGDYFYGNFSYNAY